MFHGGVIAALADTAGGYAATTLYREDVSFLTIEFKINFLRQAKGEKLIAKATVIKGGATLTVAQTDLFTVNDGKETQVATSLITLMKASR
ncbi:PaaI family thioesterase [Chitinophaga sp. OAE865]|uniref:PaaI family thioesterase n=1 Tax=Chitinophaga sp. OAE865 TaxID=2817898 RepID=UPI001AE854E3